MVEESTTKDAENAAMANATPGKKGDDHKPITCLHISSTSLSTQALADLAEISVKVTNCSETQKAKDICKEKVFGMILFEEDEDKDFITNLKAKGSCNEQTPVIYMAKGPLSEDVKTLVKDQYIDDVLFKCSSLDSDLIKAVKRLINEPLQFAVTPKSKKGESSTTKRQKLDNKIPMSARRCIAKNFTTEVAQDTNTEWSCLSINGNSYNQELPQENETNYINLDSSTAAHNTAVLESSLYPTVPVIAHSHEQRWMPSHYQYNQYNQYIPGCIPEYHHSTQGPNNNMQLLTAAAEMSRALSSIQEGNNLIPSTDKPTVTENKETPYQFTIPKVFYPIQQENSEPFSLAPQPQQVNLSNVNQMQVALQNAERAIQSSLPEMLADELVPKITLSGARQLLDSALLGVKPPSLQKKVQNKDESEGGYMRHTRKGNGGLSKMNVDEFDKGREEEKPKRSQRGRRSCTFNEDKQEWTPNTLEERKEIHLAKERKRREHIARCWHQLRRMIPMCDGNADKATVFEMTVAYVHHCWKHHADILQKINKDFERFCDNGPPEDLDEIDVLVDQLLELEDQ